MDSKGKTKKKKKAEKDASAILSNAIELNEETYETLRKTIEEYQKEISEIGTGLQEYNEIFKSINHFEAVRLDLSEQINEIIQNSGLDTLAISGTLSVFENLSSTIASFSPELDLLNSIVPINANVDQLLDEYTSMLLDTRNQFVSSQTELISGKKSVIDNFCDILTKYEDLINQSDVKEADLQVFLEENHILFDHKINRCIPQKSFGGELFPDFVVVLSNGSHVLIEIEKPQDKVYTKKGDPSAKFAHAEQQIRDFLNWANKDKTFLAIRGLPKMTTENTKGLLVIGMRSNFNEGDSERFSTHNHTTGGSYEIKTFDDILDENKQVIKSLKQRCSGC